MGGLWNGIKAILGFVLSFFYDLMPDYGMAIILLTVAVSLLLFPLTLKQTRSMRKMQEIQPEIKRLQKEHKGEREELNQELMALYKERGVNPAAGCLPLIVQMPIWFALFQVLRLSVVTLAVVGTVPFGSAGSDVGLLQGDVVQAVDDSSIRWWEDVEARFADGESHDITVMRGTRPVTFSLTTLDGLASTGVKQLDPGNVVPGDSALSKALKDGKTNFLGMDLLERPSAAASDGIANAIPYIALILLVMVTGYYQQWQTTRTRTDQGPVSQQQQGMQTAMKIMPLFLGFISWGFPTGLVLYFAASALFRIGQQALILRLDDKAPDAKEDGKSREPEPQPDPNVEPKAGPSPHASKKRKQRRRK
jgi:YidC/Oxa1 family membrane protein insertase